MTLRENAEPRAACLTLGELDCVFDGGLAWGEIAGSFHFVE
jgi:hypothetical protein